MGQARRVCSLGPDPEFGLLPNQSEKCDYNKKFGLLYQYSINDFSKGTDKNALVYLRNDSTVVMI